MVHFPSFEMRAEASVRLQATSQTTRKGGLSRWLQQPGASCPASECRHWLLPTNVNKGGCQNNSRKKPYSASKNIKGHHENLCRNISRRNGPQRTQHWLHVCSRWHHRANRTWSSSDQTAKARTSCRIHGSGPKPPRFAPNLARDSPCRLRKSQDAACTKHFSCSSSCESRFVGDSALDACNAVILICVGTGEAAPTGPRDVLSLLRVSVSATSGES